MARFTQDREDLLREATALVPRVLLATHIQGDSCEVFAGFRGEALSIYFGASPVYHFNSSFELRRAFDDDLLFKAEAGQLIRSARQRESGQVVIASKLMTTAECERFVAGLTGRLAELHDNLVQGVFRVVGQVPDKGDTLGMLREWFKNWPGPRIAAVANLS